MIALHKSKNLIKPYCSISISLVLLSICCFIISYTVMYPGWMTTDSLSQFFDARRGVYRDATPVLMSWLWNKLLIVDNSPAPMLFLNLIAYWLGFYLLADAFRTKFGLWSLLVLLFGFWPGVFEQVGFIWKDILFGTFLFAAWSIAIRSSFHNRLIYRYELCLVFILCLIGVGVKTNGIVSLPFLFMYIAHIQGYFHGQWLRNLLASSSLAVATFIVSIAITLPSEKIRQGNVMVQYTMIYDLLGISARTKNNLFPQYIHIQREEQLSNLQTAYSLGGMNSFFFKENTSLVTMDESEQTELLTKWILAIKEYPVVYAKHRLENLSSMMRIGYFTPAWVGEPGIWENDYDLSYTSNILSDALGNTIKSHPWMYLPWLYAIICITSYGALLFSERRVEGNYLFLSIVAFVAPHVFLLPAADYRYLYFSYLGTIALLVLAITSVFKTPQSD